MNIPVNTTVAYPVKTVVVDNILLLRDSKGALVILAPYRWLAADNTLLRTGTNRYPEALLLAAFQAKGQDFSAFAVVLRALIPATGTAGNCDIRFGTSTTAIRGYTDASKHWVTESLTEAQLAAAMAPLTIAQLQMAVAAFTQYIFIP